MHPRTKRKSILQKGRGDVLLLADRMRIIVDMKGDTKDQRKFRSECLMSAQKELDDLDRSESSEESEEREPRPRRRKMAGGGSGTGSAPPPPPKDRETRHRQKAAPEKEVRFTDSREERAPPPPPDAATATTTTTTTTGGSAATPITITVDVPAQVSAPREEKVKGITWTTNDSRTQHKTWAENSAQGTGEGKLALSAEQMRHTISTNCQFDLGSTWQRKKRAGTLPTVANSLPTFDHIWRLEPHQLREAIAGILGVDEKGTTLTKDQQDNPISQVNRFPWILQPGGKHMKAVSDDWGTMAKANSKLKGLTIGTPEEAAETRLLPHFQKLVQYGDHWHDKAKDNTSKYIDSLGDQEQRTRARAFSKQWSWNNPARKRDNSSWSLNTAT